VTSTANNTAKRVNIIYNLSSSANIICALMLASIFLRVAHHTSIPSCYSPPLCCHQLNQSASPQLGAMD